MASVESLVNLARHKEEAIALAELLDSGVLFALLVGFELGLLEGRLDLDAEVYNTLSLIRSAWIDGAGAMRRPYGQPISVLFPPTNKGGSWCSAFLGQVQFPAHIWPGSSAIVLCRATLGGPIEQEVSRIVEGYTHLPGDARFLVDLRLPSGVPSQLPREWADCLVAATIVASHSGTQRMRERLAIIGSVFSVKNELAARSFSSAPCRLPPDVKMLLQIGNGMLMFDSNDSWIILGDKLDWSRAREVLRFPSSGRVRLRVGSLEEVHRCARHILPYS